MKLIEAGIREKLYVKSLLAQKNQIDRFTLALETWLYYPRSDCVIDETGHRYKVNWEAQQSKEILMKYGLTANEILPY
jgi:hypothetical protein